MSFALHNLSKPWNVGGIPGRIECADTVWEEIIAFVMAGFRSGPWGGPEMGGLLLGRRTPDSLHIHAWREIACAHANGPAFELSEGDEAGLRELLANSTNDAALNGEVVGWFQSKYYDLRWYQSTTASLSFSPTDVDLHKRYFAEPGQVALIIQRAKLGPVRAGFYFWTADGALDSVDREYKADILESPMVSGPWPNGRALPSGADITNPMGPNLGLGVLQRSQQSVSSTIQARTPENSDNPAMISAMETGQHPMPGVPARIPTQIATSTARPGDYSTAFGLRYNPFAPISHAKSVYWGKRHKNQLTALYQCILSRKSIAMLIGAAGTGKTMLLASLSGLLTKAHIDFAMLHESGIAVPTFYEVLACGLALNTTERSKRAVLAALGNLAMEADLGPSALLIDEAHNLPADVLEEIRLLDNLHVGNTKLLQIVLVGQPLLEIRLEAPDLRSFKQRIARRHHLHSLGAEDTYNYIAHKLANAGLQQQDIFPSDVVREIHVYSRGNPRMINAICDNMLRICAAEGHRTAALEVLDEVRKQIPWPTAFEESLEELNPVS